MNTASSTAIQRPAAAPTESPIDADADALRAMVTDILSGTSENLEPLIEAAKAAEQSGDSIHAVRCRAAVSALRPQDRTAKINLVRALIRAGAFAAAQDVVDRLLERTPDNASLLKLKLTTLLEAGDYEVVRQWLASLADHPCASQEAFIQEVTHILTTARLFGEATAWASRGLALHGRTPLMVQAAAQAAYKARNWEEADRLWAEVATLNEGMAGRVALYRARGAVNLDRTAAALDHYKRVLELEPANSEAAQYVVRRTVASGALDDAAAILERFETEAGETPTGALLRAAIAGANGDRGLMAAIFEEGVARWPSDLELLLRSADMLADAGDWQEMASILDRVPKANRETGPWLQRRIRLANGRHDPPADTLKLVTRLLALRPATESLLRQKANLLIRLGNRREAVAALLEGVKRHPKQVAFWQAAAANLLILKKTERIDELLDLARATFDSNTPDDLVSLAEILEAGNKINDALQYAERAIAIDGERPAPRVIAARLWERRGLYVNAWRQLIRLVEMQKIPPNVLASYARIGAALNIVEAPAEETVFPNALFEVIGQRAVPMQVAETNPEVLHVTHSLAAGGAERQVAGAVASLARHATLELRPVLVGYDLNPLVGRDFFLPLVQAHDVPLEILIKERAAGSVRDLVAGDMRWREDIRLLSALPLDAANVALPLYALIRRRRPQVVHLWQDVTAVAGGMAALLAGVPRIILGARSTRPLERQRARAWLAAGYHTLLSHPHVTMLNNSRNGSNDYADWLGIEASRITTVHNGYDFAAMRNRRDEEASKEVRSRLGAGPDDVVIGGVMRCSSEKRPDLWTQALITLCRRDPRVRGVLVGDGPMRPELEATIQGAGLQDRIWFAGRQHPVEPWMAAMDLLFLTSITEGLPNVLIEAQALGVPVATMRVGGAPETVCEGETAVVIDEGSIDDITNHIWPLIADPDLRRSYGAAAIPFTDATFGAEAMTARLIELYAQSPGAPIAAKF